MKLKCCKKKRDQPEEEGGVDRGRETEGERETESLSGGEWNDKKLNLPPSLHLFVSLHRENEWELHREALIHTLSLSPLLVGVPASLAHSVKSPSVCVCVCVRESERCWLDVMICTHCCHTHWSDWRDELWYSGEQQQRDDDLILSGFLHLDSRLIGHLVKYDIFLSATLR